MFIRGIPMRGRRAVFVLILALLLSICLFPCFGANSPTVWVKELGTFDLGRTRSLIQTFDGGYAVVGGKDGGFLLMKLDGKGNMEWEKTYGTEAEFDSFANDILQTDDGGFMLAGNAFILGNEFNCSVIKVDGEGHVDWVRDYGSLVNSAVASKDGGYLLTMKSPSGGLILKINVEGDIEWSVRYEGDDQPAIIPYHVVETADGAYAFTGAKVDNPQVKVLVKFKPLSQEESTEPSKDYMALPATITAVVATTSIILVTIIIHMKKKRRS